MTTRLAQLARFFAEPIAEKRKLKVDDLIEDIMTSLGQQVTEDKKKPQRNIPAGAISAVAKATAGGCGYIIKSRKTKEEKRCGKTCLDGTDRCGIHTAKTGGKPPPSPAVSSGSSVNLSEYKLPSGLEIDAKKAKVKYFKDDNDKAAKIFIKGDEEGKFILVGKIKDGNLLSFSEQDISIWKNQYTIIANYFGQQKAKPSPKIEEEPEEDPEEEQEEEEEKPKPPPKAKPKPITKVARKPVTPPADEEDGDD